ANRAREDLVGHALAVHRHVHAWLIGSLAVLGLDDDGRGPAVDVGEELVARRAHDRRAVELRARDEERARLDELQAVAELLALLRLVGALVGAIGGVGGRRDREGGEEGERGAHGHWRQERSKWRRPASSA